MHLEWVKRGLESKEKPGWSAGDLRHNLAVTFDRR
jgi:hypothetical protein